jgi:rfaE bifunctional protein kinase chain/domain
MSPEAPVPIVAVNKVERRLGGAGNVVANLQSLAAIPLVATIIGKDSAGDQIIDLLSKNQINSHYIIRSENRTTTEKIRIINQTEHIVRCDFEQENDINEQEEIALFSMIENCLQQHPIKVIVLQDYNKGVLTATLIEKVINLAREKNIPVTVDPKKKNFFSYKNATLFKPNLKEVKEALDMEVDALNDQSLTDVATRLLELLQCENIFITLSEHGAFYMNKNNESHHLKAHPRNIVDVSGAGDTVISVASLCIGNNFSMAETAALANLAGGLVCEEAGVASLSWQQLMAENK